MRSLFSRIHVLSFAVILLLAGVLAIFFLLPLPTHAASPGLIQCGLQSFTNPPDAQRAFCTICDFFSLLQRLLNKSVLVFAAPIAALMVGYGGFLMVWAGLKGGNVQAYTKGKTVLTNAMIGIVIILASWLLIDTVLKIVGAYQEGGNFGPWYKIECQAPPISLPKHFECQGTQCVAVEGVGNGNTCKPQVDGGTNNCIQHAECNTTKHICEIVPGKPGLDKCSLANEGKDPRCAKVTHKLCTALYVCSELEGPGPSDGCPNNCEDYTSSYDKTDNVGYARDLASLGITASPSGECGATPAQNFQELQDGRGLTVCHHGCREDKMCQQRDDATVLPRMLFDIKNLAIRDHLNFQINSLMTGDHEEGSDHYTGKAIDLKPKGGTTYQQIYDKMQQEKEANGKIRLIWCENASGRVDCTSGDPNHVHISYY